MSHSDSICHVAHTRLDLLGTTWCGRTYTQFNWVFIGIDHAANSGIGGSRLVPCKRCVQAITKALSGDLSAYRPIDETRAAVRDRGEPT
ncbi:MAG: hypothetical protein ACHQWU_16915 [Gemmatimonadales bacterium]